MEKTSGAEAQCGSCNRKHSCGTKWASATIFAIFHFRANWRKCSLAHQVAYIEQNARQFLLLLMSVFLSMQFFFIPHAPSSLILELCLFICYSDVNAYVLHFIYTNTTSSRSGRRRVHSRARILRPKSNLSRSTIDSIPFTNHQWIKAAIYLPKNIRLYISQFIASFSTFSIHNFHSFPSIFQFAILSVLHIFVCFGTLCTFSIDCIHMGPVAIVHPMHDDNNMWFALCVWWLLMG